MICGRYHFFWDIGCMYDDNLKQRLLDVCGQYVAQRIAEAQQAIAAAGEAAASDGKSSAGDKYETTREMMQQEIDRFQQTLSDARRMEQVLATVDIRAASTQARLGSLVETNQGIFFLAIGVGRAGVDGLTVGIISTASPIGARLLGKSAGQHFIFNGREYTVSRVV